MSKYKKTRTVADIMKNNKPDIEPQAATKNAKNERVRMRTEINTY